METILTAGAVAALLIEGIKWAWRAYKKDYQYEFPAKFYVVALPVFSFLVEPALAWLGVGEYQFPSDLETWAKQLVIVILASLTAMVTQKLALAGLTKKAQQRLS